MTIEFFETYTWVFWLALILIFVIIEVVTVDFTFLMIALGSVAGLVADLFGINIGFQIIIAAVISVLLLFAVRPPLLRALKRGGDPALSNVDALLGSTGTVVADFTGVAGNVRLANGETWTARLDGHLDSATLRVGDRVVVTAIDGATAVVTPAERTTP